MSGRRRRVRARDLRGFDVDFRLERLARRRQAGGGRVVWTAAPWRDLALGGGGLACLVGLYVPPALVWPRLREDAPLGAALLVALLAVALAPLLAATCAGLLAWPRLVVDVRGRRLVARRRFARRAYAEVSFDEVARLQVARVPGAGAAVDEAARRVLFAELRDGRLAGIATAPSRRLVDELRRLLAA